MSNVVGHLRDRNAHSATMLHPSSSKAPQTRGALPPRLKLADSCRSRPCNWRTSETPQLATPPSAAPCGPGVKAALWKSRGALFGRGADSVTNEKFRLVRLSLNSYPFSCMSSKGSRTRWTSQARDDSHAHSKREGGEGARTKRQPPVGQPGSGSIRPTPPTTEWLLPTGQRGPVQ